MTPWRVLGMLARFFAEGLRPMAQAPHRPEPATWDDAAITGAWLGHSTILLNFFGIWIITDPILAARCGLRFGPLVIGPRRKVRPALKVSELPPIDLLLLSHGHMDHLDLWTLRRIPGRPHAVTASGLRDLLSGMPVSQITELAWDQSVEIETPHGAIRVTAREVDHWGARMRTDDWRGYCGFLLERNGRNFGFAGDTARTDFTHWPAEGKGIDALAIPIGAYDPWIRAHCDPEQAVAMADEARVRYVVPIHHQTFKLSAEPMDEPIRRFRAALGKSSDRLLAAEIGATFKVP
jgi:L-ascorbate metabolism protein UlaG (beta-lactamase superfamily)